MCCEQGENTAVAIDGPPLQPSPRINNQVQFERNGKWRNDARMPHDRDAMQLPTRNVALPDNPEYLVRILAQRALKRSKSPQPKTFPVCGGHMDETFRLQGTVKGFPSKKAARPCLQRIICHAAGVSVSAHSFQRVPRQ